MGGGRLHSKRRRVLSDRLDGLGVVYAFGKTPIVIVVVAYPVLVNKLADLRNNAPDSAHGLGSWLFCWNSWILRFLFCWLSLVPSGRTCT